MNRRNVILSYFLLSVLLIGSAVTLAYAVRHYLYSRHDSMPEILQGEVNPEQVVKEEEAKRMKEMRDIMVVYNQSQSFVELATPIPKPSPTPVPPPSPTPVIPARGYKINWTTRSSVSLKGYDGKDYVKKVGDTIQDSAIGDFKIVEIVPNIMSPQVKVQDLATNTMGVITEVAK